MHKNHTGTKVVLLYHRIGMPKLSSLVAGQYVAPGLFRAQLDHMEAERWSVVPLDEVARDDSAPEDGQLAITFDDGYLSVYEHAYPALANRGMTATIYVVSGAIGGINEWDSRAGDTREPMMSAAQVREVSDAGFEIGSHTLTHPHLTSISDEELVRELEDSRKALEDLTGKEVSSFSYPYGDYDDRVREAVIAAGYKNAVSTKLGIIGGTGIYDIPRVNVRWNALGPLLERKIRRARRASGAA